MAGLIIRRAETNDGKALERLFRDTSMGSSIRIGMERDPDYFSGAAVQAEEPRIWGGFEANGAAVGLFSAGIRRVWLDGVRNMRYLSDLRIHPRWRGSTLMARGFQTLKREEFLPGEWAQTLILEDNHGAMELLRSRRAGLPEYQTAGIYLSWLLPSQKISPIPGMQIRPATIDDLEAMRNLLGDALRRRSFSDLVELDDLGNGRWRDLPIGDFLLCEEKGRIVGMLGLWDQSGFQRMRIEGYGGCLRWGRSLYNIRAAIKLPDPGSTLSIRKATAIACKDDDPRILRALLARAVGKIDRSLFLLGLSEADPLAGALKGLRGRKARGRHFLVGWDGSPPPWKEPFSFDVARI